MHGLEILASGRPEGFKAPEVRGQVPGHRHSHLRDPEPEEEAAQLGSPAGLDPRHQVLRLLLGEEWKREENLRGQVEEIGQLPDQLSVHQEGGGLVPQSLDVEAMAGGKMDDPPLELGRTAKAIRAEGEGSPLLHRGSAVRTVGRHAKGLGPPGVRRPAGAGLPVRHHPCAHRGLGRHHLDHLGDHVPRPLDPDPVALPHVLSFQLLPVVEGGTGHGDPTHLHRTEQGHRCQHTGPAHLHGDPLDSCDLPPRLELERHGPPGVTRGGTQVGPVVQGVELDHHAVDLVVQGVPVAVIGPVVRQDFLHRASHLDPLRHRQPPPPQRLHRGPVAPEDCALHGEDVVGQALQRPRCRDGGIQLAERSRRGVPGVRKGFGSLLQERLVQRLERGEAHQHLAAHREHGRNRAFLVAEAQGHRPDGPDVLGHALPLPPVPPCHRLDQDPLLVDKLDGDPVELGLEQVHHLVAIHPLPDPLVEAADVLRILRRIQREHGGPVGHRGKVASGLRPHPLGRRVGGHELGVPRLQLLEPPVQGVVGPVGDLGRPFHVVEVVVAPELAAEGLEFLLPGERFGGHAGGGWRDAGEWARATHRSFQYGRPRPTRGTVPGHAESLPDPIPGPARRSIPESSGGRSGILPLDWGPCVPLNPSPLPSSTSPAFEPTLPAWPSETT